MFRQEQVVTDALNSALQGTLKKKYQKNNCLVMLIPKVSISLTFKLIIESYEPQQTHRIKKKGINTPKRQAIFTIIKPSNSTYQRTLVQRFYVLGYKEIRVLFASKRTKLIWIKYYDIDNRFKIIYKIYRQSIQDHL